MDAHDCLDYIPDKEFYLTNNTTVSDILIVQPFSLKPIVYLYENIFNTEYNRICGVYVSLLKKLVFRENYRYFNFKIIDKLNI